MDVLSLQSLPLGFRFRPTDEELINHYLKGKINGHQPEFEIIPEIDVCKCEPWDLPDKSVIKNDDREWFFFSPRDRKYPNGHRSNRATDAGYWKATGKDRTIKSRTPSGTALIGMKKTLVFHRGRAPKGERTHWIMHEYRTIENDAEGAAGGDQGAYVLYRLFRKPEERIILSNVDEPEESGFFNTPPKLSPADTKYSSVPAEEFESNDKHQAPSQIVQEGGLLVMPCGSKNQLDDDHLLTYKQGSVKHLDRPDGSDKNIPLAVQNCKIAGPKLLRDGLLDAIVDPYNNPRNNSPISFVGIQNSEEYRYHLESLASGATEKDPIADFLDSVLSNHSEYSPYILDDCNNVATDMLLENGVHKSVDGISSRALGTSVEPTDLSREEDLLQWENFMGVDGSCRETPVTYMQGVSTDVMHDNLASIVYHQGLDQPFGGPGTFSVNGESIDGVNDLAWRETALGVLNEEPSPNMMLHARNMGQGSAARRIHLTRWIKLRSRSNGLVEHQSKQSSSSDTSKPSTVELIALAVQEQQNRSCPKIQHEDDNLLNILQNKEQPDVDHSDLTDHSDDGLTEKQLSNMSRTNDQNDNPAKLLSKQLNMVARLDQVKPFGDQSERFRRTRDSSSVSDALTRHHCLLENGKRRSRFVRLALCVMSVGLLALAVVMMYPQRGYCA